jgi:phosphopantothenoylcysteine decarboxylase/phosphopantothenate--cysteine ligase
LDIFVELSNSFIIAFLLFYTLSQIMTNLLAFHSSLKDKHIVLGITGGISAYKCAELVRLLTQAGASVSCVLTQAGAQFITPVVLQALSGREVYTDLWDTRIHNAMAHIELTRAADLILIAPASTNCIAKLAHGVADDLLSTLCIARPSHVPLAVVPAMNHEMWANPATQRNVDQLKRDGVHIWGPASGDQACGEVGLGRMLEPAQLLNEIERALTPAVLAGKRVLLTAGPTQEAIDPVRVLTNRSSGKMGYALAKAARSAGAEVTLISGPVALAAPYGVHTILIETAQDMLEATMQLASMADIFISVAAVADWTIKNAATQKLKKHQGKPQFDFSETTDILASVAALNPAPFCVGFAAETENMIEYAQQKRARKNIPLLVANLAKDTFGKDENEVCLVSDVGIEKLPKMLKEQLAVVLINKIAEKIMQ